MSQMELFEEGGPETPDIPGFQTADDRVLHEAHRIMGFLRFRAGPDGVYTARCSPDYFILPALAEHFYLRFGETPWAIIDEKRNLCLYREKGRQPRLIRASPAAEENEAASDIFEDLWRLYHRSINNEARKNLRLQRQFMPERFRKYLTELK